MKHFCCVPNTTVLSSKGTFQGTPFFCERMTDIQTPVIQTWVFGRPFLENEQNETTGSKKNNTCPNLLPMLKFQRSVKF